MPVDASVSVAADVLDERVRQNEKWGPQSHPNGTGGVSYVVMAKYGKELCARAFAAGLGDWRHILFEEVYEAFAEEDVKALRTELIQVAAVAVAWVEDIDRKALIAAHIES